MNDNISLFVEMRWEERHVNSPGVINRNIKPAVFIKLDSLYWLTGLHPSSLFCMVSSVQCHFVQEICVWVIELFAVTRSFSAFPNKCLWRRPLLFANVFKDTLGVQLIMMFPQLNIVSLLFFICDGSLKVGNAWIQFAREVMINNLLKLFRDSKIKYFHY